MQQRYFQICQTESDQVTFIEKTFENVIQYDRPAVLYGCNPQGYYQAIPRGNETSNFAQDPTQYNPVPQLPVATQQQVIIAQDQQFANDQQTPFLVQNQQMIGQPVLVHPIGQPVDEEITPQKQF